MFLDDSLILRYNQYHRHSIPERSIRFRLLSRKSPYEKELRRLENKEAAWLERRTAKKDPALNRFLADKIPAGLQNTLNSAFFTAFETIFSRGGGIIDKTFSPKEAQKTYEINRCAAFIRPDKKNLRAFSKNARRTSTGNTALSGAAGIGMGIFGVGLPDIPILVGFLLKTVYQIAVSFGYEYASDKERYFILLLLEGAAARGEHAITMEKTVDAFIRGETPEINPDSLKIQMRRTADALSADLLYLKFIQTIPIVGAAGGISDIVCMRETADFAEMKYRRRFYTEKERNLR